MASVEDEMAAGEQALANLEYDEAYSHFEKATKLEASNAVAWFGKAESALGMPKIEADQIVGFYKKAIELDPKNPQFKEALGTLLVDMGRFNEAEQQYNQAAEADPENASYYWLGFAVEYATKAPIVMQQFLDDKTRDMIAAKSLNYALKALKLSREDAKRVLSTS
jgi:tetratricopeptide (TPR) repeat protein